MSMLIRNASFVLTQRNGILKGSDIFVDDGRIVKIGKNLKHPAEFVVDGRKKVVMPGLVNPHTHVAMTLFRGTPDNLPVIEWLQKYIWPMEARLKPKDVYYGSLIGCIEMIKNGITTFGDMYHFADQVGLAVKDIGMRALVSRVLFSSEELSTVPEGMKGVKQLKQTLKKVRQIKSSRVVNWLGPHSPYSCSEEMLKKVKEISEKEKLKINIHLSESKSEVEEMKKKRGESPVEFLDEIGFLDSTVTAAHCVHVSESDMEILKEKKVSVVHCPISNMRLGSGVAPVCEMVKKGIIVGLGTDGPASNTSLDLFQEMNVATSLHKISKNQILDFATINAAKCLGLENQIGSIEVGKRADIIVLDTKHIDSLSGKSVESVIIDGVVVAEGGKILTINKQKISEKFQKVVENLKAKNSKPL
jgi:5-methylthioadenosine/S-adenosylhomocysteine deaminase